MSDIQQGPKSKISRSELRESIEAKILENKRTGKPLYREICAWAKRNGTDITPSNITTHYKQHMQDDLAKAIIAEAGSFDREIMAANASHEVTLRGVVYQAIVQGVQDLKSGKLKIDGRVLTGMIGRAIQLLEQEVRFFERHPYEFVARVMGEVLYDEPEVLAKAMKRLHAQAKKQVTEHEKNIRELWDEAGETDAGSDTE